MRCNDITTIISNKELVKEHVFDKMNLMKRKCESIQTNTFRKDNAGVCKLFDEIR